MYAKSQYSALLYLGLVYVNKGIKQIHIPRYTILNLTWNYNYPFLVTFATNILNNFKYMKK